MVPTDYVDMRHWPPLTHTRCVTASFQTSNLHALTHEERSWMFYRFPLIIQQLLALIYKPVCITEYSNLDLFNLFSFTRFSSSTVSLTSSPLCPPSSMEVYVHLLSDIWLGQLNIDLTPLTLCTTGYLEEPLSYHLAGALVVETLKLHLSLSGLVVTKGLNFFPEATIVVVLHHISTTPPP